MEFDYFEGWKYISAIFEFFQEHSRMQYAGSYIAPRHIFRGISKRFFTESSEINSIHKVINGFQTKKGKVIHPDVPDQAIVDFVIKKDKKSLRQTISSKYEVKPLEYAVTPKQIYEVLYKEILSEIGKVNFISGFSSDLEYLKAISHSNFYNYIKPEQIRSGTSVRLRDTENNYNIIADYLSYTSNLSEGFKSINPSLRLYDETEILAEIQHRGGGSCLVDFSNNFLISLWFAVSGHNDDLGFLFCYDVNNDAFKTGNLSYLNKLSSNKDIQTLLRHTQKTSMYLNANRLKFWLWKPDNINGRIARQDSVFVFGLEKFKVKDRHVIVVPIPPQWKKPILKFLKVYLGIKAETIFPDIDGYSNAHSKISPINDTTLYINPQINRSKKKNEKEESDIFPIDPIQKGMSCLLKGEYRIGLDYFLHVYNNVDVNVIELCEVKDRIGLTKIYVEVLYSIGICYRKLGLNELSVIYCRKAFIHCFYLLTNKGVTCKILENSDKTEKIKICKSLNIVLKKYPNLRNKKGADKYDEEREDFIPKFYRIIDDYLDVLYDTKNYKEAIEVVELLIDSTPTSSPATVLRTSYNCLNVLNLLSSDASNDLAKRQLENFIYDEEKNLYHNINFLLEIVLEIMSIYRKGMRVEELVSNDIIMSKVNVFYNLCEYKNVIMTESSINWVFSDLTNELKTYFKESPSIVVFIERLVAQLIALQDSIQSNKKV